MLMSTDRILVSHVGSLPRPPTLSELLIRQDAGETIDVAELAHQVEIATKHVIDKQVEAEKKGEAPTPTYLPEDQQRVPARLIIRCSCGCSRDGAHARGPVASQAA